MVRLWSDVFFPVESYVVPVLTVSRVKNRHFSSLVDNDGNGACDGSGGSFTSALVPNLVSTFRVPVASLEVADERCAVLHKRVY